MDSELEKLKAEIGEYHKMESELSRLLIDIRNQSKQNELIKNALVKLYRENEELKALVAKQNENDTESDGTTDEK